MKTVPVLLVATRNEGKLKELRELLGELPFDLQDLGDFPSIQPVPETGQTFAENASLKAVGYARQAGLLTLADDSGLEVDALGGAPGVLSARYGNGYASDDERTAKLLNELSQIPDAVRSARFVSTIAIADKGAKIIHVGAGICEGQIAHAPNGFHGFGYDPVFIPSGFNETFAQLGAEVKNRISHRAKALVDAVDFLRSLTRASSTS